jgi:hypothetical protein
MASRPGGSKRTRERKLLDEMDRVVPCSDLAHRSRTSWRSTSSPLQILASVDDLLRAMGLMQRACTVVDATLMAALSWTKNVRGQRKSEMHQRKKDMDSNASLLRLANHRVSRFADGRPPGYGTCATLP